MWDLVRFCREQNILVQGRGSAANSAVCYLLGITAVDPISMELLFERFLSEERGEWPDIDLDLPSGNEREKVIQACLRSLWRAWRRYATANVITYRNRMAAREMGKALGFDPETLAKLPAAVATCKLRDENDALDRRFRDAGLDLKHPRLRKYYELCLAVQDMPRHLGQHRGHGHLPGTTRFRRAARTRVHARPRRGAVGQRRLRRHGHYQSRPARPRHDGRAQGFHRTDSPPQR